jgi:hypothetical protein
MNSFTIAAWRTSKRRSTYRVKNTVIRDFKFLRLFGTFKYISSILQSMHFVMQIPRMFFYDLALIYTDACFSDVEVSMHVSCNYKDKINSVSLNTVHCRHAFRFFQILPYSFFCVHVLSFFV